MSSSEISEYDRSLLSSNSDYRRLVTEYEMMLLGKTAPQYFRVDRPEPDMAAQMRALFQQYSMVEEEFE